MRPLFKRQKQLDFDRNKTEIKFYIKVTHFSRQTSIKENRETSTVR